MPCRRQSPKVVNATKWCTVAGFLPRFVTIEIALVGHRCSSVRRILPLTEHASLAHALISASGATGRLYIDIFSGLFLFFGLVAARFTTPVEMLVTVFNFLHWRLHLHSIPHPIHFAGAALLALGQECQNVL